MGGTNATPPLPRRENPSSRRLRVQVMERRHVIGRHMEEALNHRLPILHHHSQDVPAFPPIPPPLHPGPHRRRKTAPPIAAAT
ncbi:hypothetical protein LINPERPRIM_LOCUS9280 [Linum perenne]